MSMPVLLCLALALAACGGSAAAPPTPFCYQVDPDASHGVNPLLAQIVLCYDTRAACEKRRVNDTSAAGECAAPAPVAWHCTTQPATALPTADQMADVATCVPSASLCEAARPPSGTFCKPAASVACSTNVHGHLSCTSDIAGCERVRQLVTRVMPRIDPPGACTTWTSAAR